MNVRIEPAGIIPSTDKVMIAIDLADGIHCLVDESERHPRGIASNAYRACVQFLGYMVIHFEVEAGMASVTRISPVCRQYVRVGTAHFILTRGSQQALSGSLLG